MRVHTLRVHVVCYESQHMGVRTGWNVELDGAGAGMRSVHCTTDRRSTAIDSTLDPDWVQRLHVFDVGRLHVGVDEEEEGGLGAEDQHDVLRRVAARGPDVEVEVARREVGAREEQVDREPVRLPLVAVHPDGVSKLGHLLRRRRRGHLHLHHQRELPRAAEVGDGHVAQQVVLDEQQLPVDLVWDVWHGEGRVA